MKRYVEIVTSDLSGNSDATEVRVPGFVIDLTDAEAKRMWAALEPFLKAGRKIDLRAGVPLGVPPKASGESAKLRQERAEAREWLRDHGWNVAIRGHISHAMMEAFRAKTPHPDFVKTQTAVQAAREVAEEIAPPVTVIPPAPRTAARMSQKMQAQETAPAVEKTPVKASRKAAQPRKATGSTWGITSTENALTDAVIRRDGEANAAQASSGTLLPLKSTRARKTTPPVEKTTRRVAAAANATKATKAVKGSVK